jgi:hypothetical protein
MSKTSKTVAKPAPAIQPAADNSRTQPTQFANIGALLASGPDISTNPFFQGGAELVEIGQRLIELLEPLSEIHDPAADIEGYRGQGMVAKDILARSEEMAAGRLISALAGSYAYTHAYLSMAEGKLREIETRALNLDDSADREAIYGLVSGVSRRTVEVAAREAEASNMLAVISGMVNAYERRFGRYELPQRRDTGSTKNLSDQLKAMQDAIRKRVA